MDKTKASPCARVAAMRMRGGELTRLSLAVAFLGFGLSAQAAQISVQELEVLRTEAARHGAVEVMVHLLPSSLNQLAREGARIRSQADSKLVALLAELGPEALRNGRTSNNSGQARFHVTAKGIETLLASTRAISFSRGGHWSANSGLLSFDGAHQAIDTALSKNGYADVEVLAHVEGLEVKQNAQGQVSLSATSTALSAANAALAGLLRGAHTSEMRELVGVRSAMALATEEPTDSQLPVRILRINREGLLKLAASPLVRKIQPLGHQDARPAFIDPEALETATELGKATVLISLRSPLAHAGLRGASLAAHQRGNREALKALLSPIGAVTVKRDLADLGLLTAELSLEQIHALAQSKDRRLLAVELKKPAATNALATSTATMNMAFAWNQSTPYIGTGQTIVVIDSGVEAGHPFFGGRVTAQDCFGTTGSSGTTTYYSLCPGGSAATSWDSPPGTPNAATATDDHGTHVAGAAAGKSGSLSGVAPGASIHAVRANSVAFTPSGLASFYYPDDVLAALQMVNNRYAASAGIKPVVVNMSIGGPPAYRSACSDDSGGVLSKIAAEVKALNLAGIPVIAAAGNSDARDALPFPACIAGVIKVSSVVNDGIGNKASVFDANKKSAANYIDPISGGFAGETFWLTPGGGYAPGTSPSTTTYITSSVKGGGYNGMAGTSMSAPQIAGLYAIAKGVVSEWGAQRATDWFVTNGSVDVSVSVNPAFFTGTPSPATWTLRRIRLPNQ